MLHLYSQLSFKLILTQVPAAIATNAEWSWPDNSRPLWPQLELTNSSWEENCTPFRMKNPDHLNLMQRREGSLRATLQYSFKFNLQNITLTKEPIFQDFDFTVDDKINLLHFDFLFSSDSFIFRSSSSGPWKLPTCLGSNTARPCYETNFLTCLCK